eukprot:COSAG06_NODE_45922_length_351_cov_0.615079_2_plen_45_part_01
MIFESRLYCKLELDIGLFEASSHSSVEAAAPATRASAAAPPTARH